MSLRAEASRLEKPFELLSGSQRHGPCLPPAWDLVEQSRGGWSHLILNPIGLSIR